MAVVVNTGTAKLKIDKAKVTPDVHVFPTGLTSDPVVNAHLTNNFTPGTAGPTGAQVKDAWTITGTVSVSAGPGDAAELAKWQFGFIQFQKINALNLYYNGQSRSQGGILITAQIPPALSNNPGRDHADKDPNPPFMRVGTAGNLTVDTTKGLATAEVGDHPMLLAKTKMMNDKTGYTNYLAQLVDNRDFVTAFVARDPAGTYQYLSHVAWILVWNYTFTWKGGLPIKSKVTAGGKGGVGTNFDMTEATGKPTQTWVQKMLTDPAAVAKLGTAEQNAALKAAVNGPPTRQDFPDPVGHFPDNFFSF
jgi:hypothetical protein